MDCVSPYALVVVVVVLLLKLMCNIDNLGGMRYLIIDLYDYKIWIILSGIRQVSIKYMKENMVCIMRRIDSLA